MQRQHRQTMSNFQYALDTINPYRGGMSAAYLPSTKDQYGPCAEPCQHRDCALTRELAAKICGGCGKEIGFGSYYYDEGTGGLWHRVCLEIAIENEVKGA